MEHIQLPLDRRAYATDGYNKELTDEDSVLIFNDYLRVPMMPSLMLYAKRLAELDRTIDINVINQKAPKILRGNEQNKLTALNMMKQIEENRLWLWTYKDSQNFDMEVLDLTVPFVAKDLQTVKHQIWNEALTYIGVENVNTEKKERLISDEVMSNMGDVEVSRFTRLNAREQACDKSTICSGLTFPSRSAAVLTSRQRVMAHSPLLSKACRADRLATRELVTLKVTRAAWSPRSGRFWGFR